MSIGKTQREVRPATAADVRKIWGEFPTTLRAQVLADGDEILAAGGYFMASGRAVIFSDILGDVPKMTIWREAKRFLASLDRPAVAIGDDSSRAFLLRLGFTEGDEGVFHWQPR